MNADRSVIERLLPGYDLSDELGRGASGVVYAARHRHLGRDVAVKQLPRAFGADPEVKARFVTEARLLAALEHPHVVPVYDYVEDGGLCVLVLERLSGGTLWARLGAGIAPQTACATVLAVCAGLQHAHAHGVLHRDVKPDNILYSVTGRPKVADFGIAKVLRDGEGQLTHAGDVLGTPAYMAPEQAQGRELTATTDVYAVGVVLYELLAGRLPFVEEGDGMALLWRHVYEAPLELATAAPQVPAAIAAVVMGALAKAPGDRPASAEALAAALAAAASRSWGSGWLEATGVPVTLTPLVQEALRVAPPALPPPGGAPLPPPVAATAPSPVAPPAGRTRGWPTVVVPAVPAVPVPSGADTELAARDVAELRNLRLAMAGQLGFTEAEIAEFQTVTAKASAAQRLGLRDGTDPATLRAVALAAIARWRERGDDLFASGLVRDACETVTRSYESVYLTLLPETR